MADREEARLVYSTAVGRVCPRDGWPESDCNCNTRQTASSPVPLRRVVAKLAMEAKGQSGKTVTVIAGLPHNAVFLDELCAELKRACGTGGAVAEDTIELQGDLRDRVREHLQKKAFIVKG